MEWFRTHEALCLEGLNNWLNSIIVHTYDNTTVPPTMPPIVIVGTHKDVVKDPIEHEEISTKLYNAFSNSIAWDFVMKNSDGVGHRGRTELNFYPVDNTLGRRDPVMKQLMTKMENILETAEYVNELKPLRWLKCIDTLIGKKVSELPLSDVVEIARSCHIKKDDIPEFLRFMHKVSMYEIPLGYKC